MFLDGLSPLMIKDWLKDMAGRKSSRGRTYRPTTVNDWLRVLRAMVREAVVDPNLPRDPTQGVRALPQGQPDHEGGNVLTAGEVRQFLATARKTTPEHYPMILVGMTTGMRFGELSALTWEDVDLDHGVVVVRRSQVRGRVSLPKTGKVRRVPLPGAAVECLRGEKTRLKAETHPDWTLDLVFPNRDGGHHAVCYPGKAFARSGKAAEIRKRFTPHGMRRTFNTLMVEAGVDRVVLWATIGHSSERMTEHYSHVGDAARRQVTDQVAKILRLPIGSESGGGEVVVA